MHQLFLSQYESVKGFRQALFGYCSRMDADIFKRVETFNNNSICQLLVHVANCYLRWLVNFDNNTHMQEFSELNIKGMGDMETIYKKVDMIVADFLLKYKNDYEQSFTKEKPGKGILITTTPLQLYTHTITHEFHHKGQILTMSRLLGYVP